MKCKIIIVMSAVILSACTKMSKTSIVETDEQIETILSKLTLQEKAGQLNLIPIEGEPTEAHLKMIREGKIGSVLKVNGVERITKLQKIAVNESNSGIPILFQEDVIHGYKTIAPIPIAEAASWDLVAIRKSAAVAAREAAASGINLTYAPMVDISRDPRWGRLMEAAGEDPYLGSLVAAARVKGLQESNENGKNILSCVKHFAGYGASLAGRDYNIQDFSERKLREVYLPPFQAAIDAGVASLMCAYSAYDGEPLTANQFLMQDVLRDEMGFKGLAMTDYKTINNLVKTGVAENDTIATINAINAGIDMDMTSQKYVSLLPFLVESGKVSMEQVDNAVRRVLMLKKKAGLLNDPFAYLNSENEKAELLSERNIAETKDIALKSMVLLKNEKSVLPISSNVKNIAVIGPMAKATKDLLGWWSCMGNEKDVVTYFDGISNKFENAKITFAKGCEIDSFRIAGKDLIPKAVKTAQAADIVILVLGEEYWMSGEGGGTASLHLPGAQEELFEAIAKTGKPLVTVINAGRPYILTNIDAKSNAILYAWMPGTTGGTALAEILSGEFNPQGKTPMTFPYHEGQIPIFYSYRRTSHRFIPGLTKNRYSTTYRDVQNEPLYPFGYGLSYTTYDYSDIKLSSNEMTITDSITATVEITNSGKVIGTEVVQLYIGDKLCSVTRPEKELKDFTLVTIEPGDTKTVTFKITPDKLTFIGKGKDYMRIIEKGQFNLFIGKNSNELKQTTFKLK